MNAQWFQHSKWLRRLAGAVTTVLLLWGVGWLALPPLLKTQLEKRLGEQLGRQVTLGKIEFKPWSLELTLHDFAVAQAAVAAGAPAAPQAGALPQLSVKRIYINAELQSLLRLAPVVDAILVESPHLRLAHLGAGHYDVDDVLARLTSAPPAPDSDPMRFALYNLVLADGAIDFTDAPHQQTHQLSKLNIKVPFLSNLAAQREVVVVPQLSFVLNGSHFDSTAQSTPFAETHKTEASLKVSSLDLAPYLVYQPAKLPLRLTSAVLDADLKLVFEQTSEPMVSMSGLVQASQVKLVSHGEAKTPQAADLLEFNQLTLQLKDVQPLKQNVQLASLTLTGPRVSVTRDRAGQLNWLALFKPANADKPTTDASAKPAWKASLDQLTVQSGQVQWQDDSTAVPSRLQLSELNVTAAALSWPVAQAMPFEGHARLDAASLSFKGSASDQNAQVSTQLTDLPLGVAAPYVAQALQPRLDGVLNATLNVNWQAATQQGQEGKIEVLLPQLTLDQVTLAPELRGKQSRQSSPPLASIKQALLENVTLDVTGRTASLGRVSVIQPQTRVLRAANGRWMFEDWLTPQAEPSAAQARAGKPWTLAVQQLDVSKGQVGFVDQSTAKPVVIAGSAVSLQLKNFSSAPGTTFGLNLAARVQHERTTPGQLDWRGSGKLSPLQLQGQLTAKRLPLQALEPYLAGLRKVELLRAEASFNGQVNFVQQASGIRLKVRGDSSVEDLQANTLSQQKPFQLGEELLNWKTLSLRGLSLDLEPGIAPRLDVRETVLSDFYARLILSEAGRFNLQDVVKSDLPEPELKPVANPATGNTPALLAAASDIPAVMHFGPVSLLGGRVDFSDNFIKPNYSAHLSELAGKLSAFSSQAANGEVQLADLELRGRAEGTATLEILGKVNPLAKPLALDIVGKVRDLELPPLSPYSARYAGYGIERGKLSVDVAYKVQPDGQLTANNKIVLNQLKFGDEVPGAEKTLPVKLAVALLADRNGVIDINLPVSGSLNDPQFRLGPIVFKLIVNLIVKAVTAPFALLANVLGGGGDELSVVNFAPGSATLSPEARAGLDKVAHALLERPALNMTVLGSASLAHEREAYKRAQLQALVLAEKRRVAVLDGADADKLKTLAVSEQDYPVLLKAVYKRADFPKPRNLIGMAKDIPVPEMEALLLANLNVTESAMQALAEQRGVAVRDYLASLKLPMERLFLGAAKTVPADAKWQPRAELQLATQ